MKNILEIWIFLFNQNHVPCSIMVENMWGTAWFWFGLLCYGLKMWKKVDVMHSSPISAPQEIITVLDAKWRFYGKIAMPEVRRFTYNDKSCLSALWN